MTTIDRLDHDWATWRASREEELRQPYGVLSQVALYWLGAGPDCYDQIPGSWWTDGHAALVRLDGTDCEGLSVQRGPHGVGRIVVPEAGSRRLSTARGVEVEVILRGGHYGLRVRDPEAPALARFTGVPSYAFDERWVLSGSFVPYDTPRTVTLDTVIPDIQQTRESAGEVHFVVDDRPHQLVTFGIPADGLSALFADATSDDMTAGWRVLALGVPDSSGQLTVDFNRAVNLPFAFNDYGTCPKPPTDNVLDLAVLAGEQTPPR